MNYVYFMESDNHIKVGITKNISSRTKQVQTGCPVMIYLVRYITTKSREESLLIEKYLHEKLKHLNTFGEWFFTKGQNVMTLIHKGIKHFGYTKDDIEIHLDKTSEKTNEISETIHKSIIELRDKDITYENKITKLSKYLNSISSRNDNEFIYFKKDFIIHVCNSEIKRYMRLIKVAKNKIDTEVSSQLHIEFEKDLEEKRNQKKIKMIEYANRSEQQKVRLSKMKQPKLTGKSLMEYKKNIYKKYGL